MARAIDWTQYDTLKAQGLADREIARQWEIPWSMFCWEKQRGKGHPLTVDLLYTSVHPPRASGTPNPAGYTIKAHSGTPRCTSHPAHHGPPEHIRSTVHRSTPQYTDAK